MTLNSTSNGQQLELGSIINSAYQSLLNQNLEKTGQALTKICSVCGVEKPIEAFRVGNHNTGWTRSGCYQCELDYGKQLNWVHRNSPPIGSVCEFPGCNSTENLVLHHDHNNPKITATICNKHNVDFGRFDDDPKKMREAADWLDSLKEKFTP